MNFTTSFTTTSKTEFEWHRQSSLVRLSLSDIDRGIVSPMLARAHPIMFWLYMYSRCCLLVWRRRSRQNGAGQQAHVVVVMTAKKQTNGAQYSQPAPRRTTDIRTIQTKLNIGCTTCTCSMALTSLANRTGNNVPWTYVPFQRWTY